MFTSITRNKPFAVAALVGVASVVLTAQAAFAAPYNPQDLAPQAAPVMTETTVYTHTEVTRTAPELRIDNDRDYQNATTTGERSSNVSEVINPDGIRYMSGGIGADEQAMFKAAEADYPVKVTFANSNGAFMSDVEVMVKNSAGETVLGLYTDGPILMMDLKPGNYTLTADDGSEVKTQKLNVTDKIRSHTLHFKTTEPVGYDRTAG